MLKAIVERTTPRGIRVQILAGPMTFISSELLPSSFQEGDALIFKNGQWRHDQNAAIYRQKLIHQLVDDLFI
jgi:Protein of unknown function (DUF3006).